MERSRIPNRLKKYRRMAGMSQRDVAEVLNTKTTVCISRWEKGICFPSLDVVFKLSLLYTTSPIHLYFDLWELLKQEISIQQTIEPGQDIFNANSPLIP